MSTTAKRICLAFCSCPSYQKSKVDADSLKKHIFALDLSRKRSIIYIILFMFLSSINFTAVIPSLFGYLKALKDDVGYNYLGMSLSSYSFGQMIASPLFGWVAIKIPVPNPRSIRHLAKSKKQRGAKHLIVFGMFLEILGSVLYVIAAEFDGLYKIWAVIVARFIVGFGVGASAIYRGYVNSASKPKEQSFNNFLLTIAQSLGFIVGPALQSAFTFIPESHQIQTYGFHFNTYTAIGHITVLLSE
ncbi:Major facilitator superfamily domain-containing protein 8 [Cichlidogyrus casuarinus]|uniref:Major facilitator superfamily domain-containing protein 8 n=1 Tax=Cichlidogyrus casuarinus TaxID=1844966 RepID=A0ABD2PV12_9PLAT